MKILLGMSGGFDSTYAALKLKREGHSVEGILLVMHEYTDVESAAFAARDVGIPLHVLDCTERFESIVKENFLSEYKNARTPNPCIICNREVKFKCLYDYATEHGFDRIATGHYARVVKLMEDGGCRYAVARARDEKKDQSYMLARLSQEELSMLCLPLSDELKSDLRERALAEGVKVADKKDSQEICFIGDGDYASYIEEKLGTFPEGRFVDAEGETIGTHKGIIRYTVGQRKGLRISADTRVFIESIDPVKNEIKISKEMPKRRTLKLEDTVFSGLQETDKVTELNGVSVKVRYGARPIAASVVLYPDGSADVELNESAGGVAPGQTAVVYRGDTVLLAGFIR